MRLRLAHWLAALILLAAPLAAGAEEPPQGSGPIWVIELNDTINPGSTDYLLRGLAMAETADAGLIVITLDTPGGLAESMRQMAQAILKCTQPVAVYVSPPGARATSAGAFLVLAGHISAMAPATHMGASSPVAAGGKEIEGTMAKKAISDLTALIVSLAKKKGIDPKLAEEMVTEAKSYDAGQAKELGLVEIIAPDLGSLIKAVEGKVVTTGAGKKRISTKGKTMVFHQPGAREKLLSALANPNLAFILLMVGMAGIYFELSNPGSIFPGVVGALSLILAFFAMSALPVSYAGLALIGLAVVLFIAEIKVTSYGLLSVAGAVSLLLGSMMLFESEDDLVAISWAVLVPTLGTAMLFFATVAYLAGRAQLKKSVTGMEGLVGEKGVVFDSGRVRVQGELWRARSREALVPGQEVVVRRAEGLSVEVDPVKEKDI
ncbi:MAG: nodulation protein NfeD [Desulfarculaceae bacterium]|jgi:membrane-bound serine protease (ClpP class)